MAVAVVWTVRGHWVLADRFCHRPFAQEIGASLFVLQALLPHTNRKSTYQEMGKEIQITT